MKSATVFRLLSMIVLCGFSFFRYMRRAGISGEPGLIILSSNKGANYGRIDLSRARTLISLRRLDLIKHLEMFVSSLVMLLPPQTCFVGCFAHQRNTSWGEEIHGTGPHFLARLLHHHAAGNSELSRERVSALLGRCGMVVIDMKEMNGLTYFHSRKRSN